MNYLIKRIWWLTTLLLLFWGCSKETPLDNGGEGENPKVEDVTVVINLKVVGSPVVESRAAGFNEAAVNNIDVFVFDKNLKLSDWQYGIIEDSGTENLSFSAILKASKDSDDKFRIMVLANVRETTYPIFGGNNIGGHKGKSYVEVCELLTATVPTQTTVFSKGIPMWGELKDMVLLDKRMGYSMNLVRSLTRVDVGTNPNPNTSELQGEATYAKLDNFSLEKVYLFNSTEDYMVAPNRANYNFVSNKVEALSLPTIASKESNPAEYSDDKRPNSITREGGVGYAITSHIYVGEADVLVEQGGVYGDEKHLERTAVVVGGYYSELGEKQNTTELSYYRLDFKQGVNSTKLNDLLRNNNYQVVIRSVNGAGSKTPDEAYKKYSVDVEAEVITWTPSDQSELVVDGQNYLKVSEHNFVLGKWENYDTRFNILTNQEGWKAKIVEGSGGWITLYDFELEQQVNEVSGVSGDDLRFCITAIGSGLEQRTATIRVAAGNMLLDVLVKQTVDDQEFMLKLSEHEMHFVGRKFDETTEEWVDPDGQDLKITYGPTLHKYKISLTSFSGGGISGFELPDPAESNLAEIRVNIDAIDPNSIEVEEDPFYERSSRLGITVQNIDGTDFITKRMLIHQTFYSLLLTGTKDYYMQGESYTLTIRSNSQWKATLSGDQSVFSEIRGTSGNGQTSWAGEKLTFKIKENIEPGSTAYITFESPNNLFPSETIAITAENFSPNSYMISPGESIDIPVRKAYRIWAMDRDLLTKLENVEGERAIKLVWQDTWEEGKGVISSLEGLTSPVDERDATFRVNTNNLQGGGNALVAFTIDDKIYWSWHIWVTDYKPNKAGESIDVGSYTMMTYNLGATSNVPPINNMDVRARGLKYQLGRKDPWLGERGINNPENSIYRAYYDESGNELYMDKGLSPAGVNLAGSIHNPMHYYAGTYGNSSWYGAFVDIRADFWNVQNYVKGDFDPCPEGWKVPPLNFYEVGATPTEATNGMMYGGSYFSHSATISLEGNLIIASHPNYAAVSRMPGYYRLTKLGIMGVNSRPAYACSVRCVKE